MADGFNFEQVQNVLLAIRQIVMAATWDSDVEWDTLGFFKGVYVGATQNLPKGTMIERCTSNGYDLFLNFVNPLIFIGASTPTNKPWTDSFYMKFVSSDVNDWIKGLAGIQGIIRNVGEMVFNCFYTVQDPVKASNFNKELNIFTILWNLLFNLGTIYTSIWNGITFFYRDRDPVNGVTPTPPTWESFGKNIGALLVSVIYSKYVNKTYYPF